MRAIEVGRGFRVGALTFEGPSLVLGTPEFPMVEVDAGGFRTVKEARPGARSSLNCPVAFDALRRVVYFSDGDLHAWNIATGSTRCVAHVASVVAEAATTASRRDRPGFNWLLEIDSTGSRIVTMAHAYGAHWVVELEPEGSVTRRFEVQGWAGGMSVDVDRGWICQPVYGRVSDTFSAAAGSPLDPVILDLDGKVLFRFSDHGADERLRPEAACLTESSISPSGSIALAGMGGPLAVWEPERASSVLIDARGRSPRWSRDGSRLWYHRGETEVWSVAVPGGEPEMLARLSGTAEARRCWYTTAPTVSRNGRYVYFDLADQGSTVELAVGIADLHARIVEIFPGVYAQNVTFLV